MKAGQGKIVEILTSALERRHDMIQGEAHILPALACVTILAEIISSLADLFSKFVG